MADQVSSDSDVAYVTGVLETPPPHYGPLSDLIYYRSYTVNAKTSFGITMFWTQAAGWFTFRLGWEYSAEAVSSHGVKLAYLLKYQKLNLEQSVGETPHTATVYATGHFRNRIINTYPWIYAWITCQTGGTTLYGGSVHWA